MPHSHNIISIQIHRHSHSDKVSDDFIFLSIKGTCPNQNLVAHHQFLENLPGKASMYAFIHLKLISNLQGFYQYIMADILIITRADYENIPGSFF